MKNSTESLNKLKTVDFQASSISIYDLSPLYTSLSHELIKHQLIILIEHTFRREKVF